MRDTVAIPTDRMDVQHRDGAIGIVAITAFSGFAGLGYEIVWTRLLAVALGHEIIAVLGVLAALFAGLALGSLFPGQRIATSERPARWYAALELVIGGWAVALIFIFPIVVDLVPTLLPLDATPARQWLVTFGLPFLLLLPATLAMGGTLPALEAILASRLRAGGAVSYVYGGNTFGAVAGTLVTTFVLIPEIGLNLTLATCAAINLICAALSWRLGGVPRAPTALRRGGEPPVSGGRVRLAVLFLTGFLGIGYEVLTIRVVSQILENTIYTFALLLASYLFGTALGATLQGWLGRRYSRDAMTAGLVLAASVCCIGGTLALTQSGSVLTTLRELTPATTFGRLAAELGIATMAFLLPTIAMGALFTQLAQTVRDSGGYLGSALAANTFGAAVAPLVFGTILIPLVGAKIGFAVVSLGYLLALPKLRRSTAAMGALAVAASVVVVAAPLSLRFMMSPPGGTIVWHRDGVMAAVSVIQDAGGPRHLQVNNHFRMGGDMSVRSDYREAHIPLLLHPDPKRALFLGLGTGTTLSAAGDHPGMIADGVELVPEVVESFPLFARSAPQIGRNPNLRIHISDARRFVRTAGERYDVVVADLYHPSLDGSGALYTREHFEAIRARLSDDGLFCQWLPLYQLDSATLRIIIRTFLAAFPNSEAYLAQFSTETPLIALVGRRERKTYPPNWLSLRIKDRALAAKLAALDLKDATALFGLYLANAGDLQEFAGPGSLNTDDHPLVTAQAPRVAYATTATPGAQLVQLLNNFHPQPKDIMGDVAPEALARLADYWRARDRFINVGVQTKMSGDTLSFIAAVAPHLVDVVRISADFDAAYNPVIAMARELARSDVAAARKLLETLDGANPGRPDARQLLTALPPG